MSRVYIERPEILSDLSADVTRFSDSGRQVVDEVMASVRETIGYLQSCCDYWRRQVQIRQDAYDNCMSSRDEDGRAPNCGCYAAELAEAEGEWNNAQLWLERVETSQDRFGAASADFQKFLDESTAAAFLSAKLKAVFSYLRGKAVAEAWAQETELVKRTAQGTREWTPSQLRLIGSGQRVRGYEGHHIRSVNKHSPKWAADPRNIMFVTRRQHLRLHGGRFANPTTGKLIDRRHLAAIAVANSARTRVMKRP